MDEGDVESTVGCFVAIMIGIVIGAVASIPILAMIALIKYLFS